LRCNLLLLNYNVSTLQMPSLSVSVSALLQLKRRAQAVVGVNVHAGVRRLAAGDVVCHLEEA
jgi:hypothetical protein